MYTAMCSASITKISSLSDRNLLHFEFIASGHKTCPIFLIRCALPPSNSQDVCNFTLKGAAVPVVFDRGVTPTG